MNPFFVLLFYLNIRRILPFRLNGFDVSGSRGWYDEYVEQPDVEVGRLSCGEKPLLLLQPNWLLNWLFVGVGAGGGVFKRMAVWWITSWL